MLFELIGIDLTDRKREAKRQVNTAAEAARQQFITPGDGQSQEYALTEAEARAYKAAGYPTPFDDEAYPMLHAEMLAQEDAGAIGLGSQIEIDAAAHFVTDATIVTADLWIAAAKEIKRLRRSATIKIEAATTYAAIYEAAQITWPTP